MKKAIQQWDKDKEERDDITIIIIFIGTPNNCEIYKEIELNRENYRKKVEKMNEGYQQKIKDKASSLEYKHSALRKEFEKIQKNKNKINIQNHISKQNNSIDNRKIKKNININKENKNKKKIKKRKGKYDLNGRIFQCQICKKSYLSYPALYTHNRNKHDIIPITDKPTIFTSKKSALNKYCFKYNQSNISINNNDDISQTLTFIISYQLKFSIPP